MVQNIRNWIRFTGRAPTSHNSHCCLSCQVHYLSMAILLSSVSIYMTFFLPKSLLALIQRFDKYKREASETERDTKYFFIFYFSCRVLKHNSKKTQNKHKNKTKQNFKNLSFKRVLNLWIHPVHIFYMTDLGSQSVSGKARLGTVTLSSLKLGFAHVKPLWLLGQKAPCNQTAAHGSICLHQNLAENYLITEIIWTSLYFQLLDLTERNSIIY